MFTWSCMNKPRSNGMFLSAIFFAIVSILQWIVAVRYIVRLPGDLLGIGLSVISAGIFTVVAIAFYSMGLKEKYLEKTLLTSS